MAKGYLDRWLVTWGIGDEEESVIITPESLYLNFLVCKLLTFQYTVKPILRGHLCDKENVVF